MIWMMRQAYVLAHFSFFGKWVKRYDILSVILAVRREGAQLHAGCVWFDNGFYQFHRSLRRDHGDYRIFTLLYEWDKGSILTDGSCPRVEIIILHNKEK
jgi:hypothetical protein